MPAVLEVQALTATLSSARLVDGISFELSPGRLHALVGESGSGKSMTALALMGLVPDGVAISGQVRLEGVELITLRHRELRRARGRAMSMMLQEPLTALNPVLTVQTHLVEAVLVHHGGSASAARARTLELLHEVGVSDAEARLRSYPHELSGGMRQRVLLAAALAGEPKVLIADEPTTALDSSLRTVVVALLRSLAKKRSLAVLLLTHDLAMVREACDEVSVMYAGRIVESGEISVVLNAPKHPYTAALLRASPVGARRGVPLETLEGHVPLPNEAIEGCRFRPRCAYADEACQVRPPLERGVACHHPVATGEPR